MKNEELKDKLARIGELVDSGDVLERDLALELLRGIYFELKFGGPGQAARKSAVAIAEPAVEAENPSAEACPSPEPEVAEESVPVSEPGQGQEPEPDPLPGPEPAPRQEDMSARHRRVAPEVIRSLYGDAPAEKLGDVINPGRQTLGETLRGDKKDMASHLAATRRHDLKHSIGINDKFLMIRDMFDGDTTAFNDTIAYLDTFSDLDEAIIYIHDTYNWSADSDGVKLLVDLLERKLG